MIDLLNTFDISLSEHQLSQFDQYFDFLVSENEKYNLTAITEKKDVYVKHFLDSMLISKLDIELKGAKIMDIGTGAGFPSVPISILEPSVKITGLDSLNKRIHFLNQLAALIGIQNYEFVHGRAEDFGQDKKYRETYDIAVSRAVAELRLLLEYVMPFVKPGGYFIAYKSVNNEVELESAKNALKCLKTSLVDVVKFDLPLEAGERNLMIFKKEAKLEKKYPRKAGTPKKNPL